jgi:hypothetical protein
MFVWKGSKNKPVRLEEVEAFIEAAARQYNRAKVLLDPWQAVGMTQRLKSRGVNAEEFPFSAQSVGRLANALHLSLRNRLIDLPDEPRNGTRSRPSLFLKRPVEPCKPLVQRPAAHDKPPVEEIYGGEQVMRFKVIAALVVVAALMGASAGVALATSRSSHAKTGVETYWVANWSRTTGNPTTFVGTGLFTDAGSVSGGNLTLSKGSFVVDRSKLTSKFTNNTHTCFIIETFGGKISLGSGKGAYKGISGRLSVSGKVVAVLPRRKNGKCNEAYNAIALGFAGGISGSGKVTLGS